MNNKNDNLGCLWLLLFPFGIIWAFMSELSKLSKKY